MNKGKLPDESAVTQDYRSNKIVGVACDSGMSQTKTRLAALLEESATIADDLNLFVNGMTLAQQLYAVIGHMQRSGDVAVPE